MAASACVWDRDKVFHFLRSHLLKQYSEIPPKDTSRQWLGMGGPWGPTPRPTVNGSLEPLWKVGLKASSGHLSTSPIKPLWLVSTGGPLAAEPTFMFKEPSQRGEEGFNHSISGGGVWPLPTTGCFEQEGDPQAAAIPRKVSGVHCGCNSAKTPLQGARMPARKPRGVGGPIASVLEAPLLVQEKSAVFPEQESGAGSYLEVPEQPGRTGLGWAHKVG